MMVNKIKKREGFFAQRRQSEYKSFKSIYIIIYMKSIPKMNRDRISQLHLFKHCAQNEIISYKIQRCSK